ncbi:MAG: hypothetical protein PVI50_03430 [Gammaproteobacteria bacterium]|jgi:hypothetical protein
MNGIVPRFEFRTFGRDFARIEENIRRLSADETLRESREVYILRPKQWQRNIKIRGGRLEVKELIEQRDGLQRWNPAGQWTFPLKAGELENSILPGLRSDDRRPGTQGLSKQRLLGELVRDSHVLWRANVFKRRVGYTTGECSTEIDEILVNGALVRSVAIESEDADAVVAIRRELGLADHENVSYPLAIARIMGLEPLPDEDRYG